MASPEESAVVYRLDYHQLLAVFASEESPEP